MHEEAKPPLRFERGLVDGELRPQNVVFMCQSLVPFHGLAHRQDELVVANPENLRRVSQLLNILEQRPLVLGRVALEEVSVAVRISRFRCNRGKATYWLT